MPPSMKNRQKCISTAVPSNVSQRHPERASGAGAYSESQIPSSSQWALNDSWPWAPGPHIIAMGRLAISRLPASTAQGPKACALQQGTANAGVKRQVGQHEKLEVLKWVRQPSMKRLECQSQQRHRVGIDHACPRLLARLSMRLLPGVAAEKMPARIMLQGVIRAQQPGDFARVNQPATQVQHKPGTAHAG